MAETILDNLVINYLSQEQYAKANLENNIDENMLYFTPELAGGTGTVILNSTDTNEAMYNKIFSSVKSITNADGDLEPRLAKDILYVDTSGMPKKYYRAIGVSATYTNEVCSWISLQFYRADNQQQQYFVLIANTVNNTKSITKTSNWSLTSAAPIDGLNSIDTEKALSANQGRILNEKIEALDGGSSEGLYFWDGKSSDTNADNIALWQEIIDRAREGLTSIVAVHGTYSYQHYLFLVSQKCLGGTMTTLKSLLNDAGSRTSSGNEGTVRIDFYVRYGQLNIEHTTDYAVTKVNTVTEITNDLDGYLPTHSTTLKAYTPTYDYHPATKKYVDDQTIFHWDGRSSEDNPDNIAIWQAAIEKSLEKDTFVIATGKKYKTTIFRIGKGTVNTTGTFSKLYDGIIEDLWASQAADTGTGLSYNMSSVQVQISDFVVTKVNAMGSSVSGIHMNNTRFLPTTGETVSSYEPTYDYHPATKKYVDDLILGALNASY